MSTAKRKGSNFRVKTYAKQAGIAKRLTSKQRKRTLKKRRSGKGSN